MSVTRALLVVSVMSAMMAWATEAGAQPAPDEMTGSDVRAVGGGYELYFGGDQLRVRKGKRSAALYVGDGPPNASDYVEVKTAAGAVRLSYLDNCDSPSATYSHDQLAARLDVEEGEALAKQGKHAAAAKLLGRAVVLDPGYERAVRDYARTLVKLGRGDEAVAVLGARLADPVQAYSLLSIDPQLTSLLEHPALVQQRAAAPGTAMIDATPVRDEANDGMTLKMVAGGQMARGPGGQLASISSLELHGICATFVVLGVLDGKTGASLGGLSLIGPEDYHDAGCDHAKPFSAAGLRQVQANVVSANRMLAVLGFEPVVSEVGVQGASPRPGVQTWRFPQSGLGLVAGLDGSVRFFQRGKLLLEHPLGTADLLNATSVTLVPGEHRVLIERTFSGCEHSLSSDSVVLTAP